MNRWGRLTGGAFLVAVALTSTSPALAQTDGIFADFTTSLGSFTCQLDYTNAPRSAANFIALATGQRAWLDLVSGHARTRPFYDGLTFHRVIANFMNQAGSPNGQGTDGPGYVLQSECRSNLVFSSFGVLAMANSGPNSDGSQFFITTAPFPTGNNLYSIFGRLTAGSNVVYAINHVATSSADKPLTNVVIQQVAIRRLGPAAMAFDIHGQGLPLVTNVPIALARVGSSNSLTFTHRLFAHDTLYSNTNLTVSPWVDEDLGIETTSAFTNCLSISTSARQQFFSLAQVQYPSSTFAPRNLRSKTFNLTFLTGVSGTLRLTFDAAGNGVSDSLGTITSYSWSQGVYRGWLWPIYFSGYWPMTLQFNFASVTSGTFSGTIYATTSFSVTGNFTWNGP